MRRLAKTLAVVLALGPAAAGMAAENVTGFTLDNGMEVVVIEDHRAPLVVHMVWYRAGAADEPPGQSGAAHFLEHLMFKGTEELEPGEFSATVAAQGGRDNAFTSYDYTAYFQRVAADRLGLMMEMEADRMTNLALAEEDIVTERGVVLEERNQRVENEPGALFREQVSAALWLNHPYGAPVIGWQHEIAALDEAAVKAFYRRFYAPNNAILIVAGDTTPEEVRRLAEEHYGPIPENPAVRALDRPKEPPHRAARRVKMEDARVAQPYVMRQYRAPKRNPGDQEQAAALLLLAEILGGGQTSVLTQRLQFEEQLSVYAGAYYGATRRDDSTIGFFVVPSEGVSLEEAEEALDRVLEDFMETGVDSEQLERIKLQLRASLIYERDDVQALANRYGRALASGLTLDDIAAWPEVLQAVTEEDIMAVAREVLVPESSVTGWLSAGDSPVPAPDAGQPALPDAGAVTPEEVTQ
ncbi:M16 family metallopeptidase [Rhodosalinus sp.]|uniref:M16 family metallopeptidase n=1 Tax=Rhodosalinus sp. TaxID=2047741 RepID=UPI00397C5F15